MALKRVINLTEGPLDYLRGAAQQVAPAMRNVAAGGRQASAAADLLKAVKVLAQLVQQDTASQASRQASPAPTQPGVQASGTTSQMSTRPQMTFSSYLQDIEGDRLDEGVWDFVKGAGAEVGRQLKQAFAPDSALGNVLNAGLQGHRDGAARRLSKRTQAQLKVVQQILQRTSSPQNALRRALKQAGVSGAVANKVFSMVFPSAQQRPQQAQQPAAPTRSSTSWQQGAAPAQQPAQQPAQRPARQAPANPRRRPRPVTS